MADFNAFTHKVPQFSRLIVVAIEVDTAIPLQNISSGKNEKTKLAALVDSGATTSCISKEIALKLKLPLVSMTKVQTAQDLIIVPSYYINVVLPNGIFFGNCKVNEFSGNKDFHFIIGMDIIRKGDTAITNANHEMLFSFRIPPDDNHVDYAAQKNALENCGDKAGF